MSATQRDGSTRMSGPATGAIPIPARTRRARSQARARTGVLQGVAGVAYVVLGLAIATAMAWPIYATPRLAILAAVAAVPAVGIPLLVAWRRWPVWSGPLLELAAYLVLVVPLAVPSGLRSPLAAATGLRDGITGVVLGWKQLLTLETPLGDYQAVLVPFLVVALAGTAAATGFAISAGARAAAAVPIVLLMSVFGIAFGSSGGGASVTLLGVRIDSAREVGLGLLAVAISLGWLVLRARMARRAALAQARADAGVVSAARSPLGPVLRRRLLAALLLIGALVAGLVVAPVLTGVTPRSTLRTGVEPMLVVRAQTSPLGQYRGHFDTAAFDEPLFRISGATSGIDRVRLAVLDTWDGTDFTVGSGDAGRFTRLPGGVAASGSQTVHVTAEKGLDGIWMPLPDGVRSAPVFTGPRAAALADGFYLDRTSDAGIQIAAAGASGRGLRAGDGYTVEVAPSTRHDLGDPSSSSLLDLQAYPQLAGWLKAQAQPRSASGFEELVARLRERGYLTHSLDDGDEAKAWIDALQKSGSYTFQPAYAGHSTARIEGLFQQLLDQQNRVGAGGDPKLLVAGIGDDEQFASATALLARAVGYDSRVVLGVRMTALQGSGVPACTSGACASGDLAAWVEVRAPGAADWTSVDAEPQYSRLPTLITTGQQLPENATVPEQPKVATVQPPTSQHDDTRGTKHDQGAQAAWLGVLLAVLRVVGLALGAIVLVLLPAIVLAVAKRMRRGARRSARVPEVAVVGAWAELVDAWTDGGLDAGRGTRRDQAHRIGSDDAARLAVLADDAVFAEHPPTRQVADDAWRLADAELARRAEILGGWRRLRAAVSPTSFVRAAGLRPPRLRLPSRRAKESR